MLSKQERIGQYFVSKKAVKAAYQELKKAESYAEKYPHNELASLRISNAEKSFAKAVKDHWGQATPEQVNTAKNGIEKIISLRRRASKIKKDRYFINLISQDEPLTERQKNNLKSRLKRWGFADAYEARQFLTKTGLK